MQRDDLLATQQHALLIQVAEAGNLGGNLLLTGLVIGVQGILRNLPVALLARRGKRLLRRP